jgi:radical SAM superfamily enzyme with C-terminal helix-hairpin-helix motif
MKENYTIIDCYTDEPSGLGVPPYLGTFPRYIYGALKKRGIDATYLTIDDMRLWKKFGSKRPNKEKEVKTNIKIYNLTKNSDNVESVLKNTTTLIIIAGINVPGKYLSAEPGTLYEVTNYIKEFSCRKILTGTAAIVGSQSEGGKMPEHFDKDVYSEIEFDYLDINDYSKVEAVLGAGLIEQIPWEVIAEIETGRGCDIGKCSFCTEPIKSRVQFRDSDDVVREMRELSKLGVMHFRFGKQTCFFSYKHGDIAEIEKILKSASELRPKTLHIDNVNPNKVIGKNGREIACLIVKYCTAGNIAAFGVESFDQDVVRKNKTECQSFFQE